MKLSNISNTIVQKDPTSSTKMLDTSRFALHAQYYKEKSPLSLNKSNLKNFITISNKQMSITKHSRYFTQW